ncbi:hypothetical protein FRC00_003889 [Tulasnella sp. 408]|nr:hypothetical protein FRC00_003889 [Tulasnella sp. 408]
MASFKPAPPPSSTPKSSIHISIRAARDMILGASSHSNPLPLHSNLDARHPPSKRAPRKRLALNTKLYFSGNSSIPVTHAVVKPKLVGWEGGLKLVDGETDVPLVLSSGSPGSQSSDQNSTTLVTSESLAMAILAVGSSDNNSTPTSRTSLRTALFQLPPSARPFQYTSYRNALDGPQVRNVYTPKFVQGQGWVPAFGGVNNEPEPVPAPSRPAATNNGPRYPVRASRAKPVANAEAGAGGEAGEADAPVEEKTAAPTKPGGKGKNKNHGKGKAKARAGSHDNKSSPPPSSTASQAQAAPKDQPPKRSHKKKVPAPSAPPAETTAKATSPVPPTHSYSTRRAGGMTRSVSNGSNSNAKGRTSPSGSDETLVERGGSALPSDSVSKIIPEPAPVPAVV